MQHAGDEPQTCTPETCVILLTSFIPINLIFLKSCLLPLICLKANFSQNFSLTYPVTFKAHVTFESWKTIFALKNINNKTGVRI